MSDMSSSLYAASWQSKNKHHLKHEKNNYH